MRRSLSVISAVTVVLILLTASVSASEIGGLVIEDHDYGGNWIKDGTTYTCRERIDWPDFGVYMLGNTAEKIRLYMELTVSSKTEEPDSLGGDSGFLVGVTDVNGNGIIEENEDNYYLIDVSSSNDGAFIGIEKNEGQWSNWETVYNYTGFSEGDVIGLYLLYDPQENSFAVYVTETDEDGNKFTSDEPWVDWIDNFNPLTGTGYGICSKITGSVFTNVSVASGDNAKPPEKEGGYEGLKTDENGNPLIADLTDPGVVNKIRSSANDCTIEYDEAKGCMKVTVTGGDPFFVLPMNLASRFDGDDYPLIVIDCMTDEPSMAEIFYATKESPDIVKNHIFFNIEDTEDFTPVTVYMYEDDYGNWTGQINTLRIDPNNRGSEGQVYYFRSVKAMPDPDEDTETVTDDVTTAAETEQQTEPVTTVTDTEAEPQTTEPQTTEPEKGRDEKNNTGIIIAAVVCAVLIIAAVAAAVIISKKRKK